MASACKKPRCSETNDQLLESFNLWLDKEGFQLSNKVFISSVKTSSNYGLLAKDDIDQGEVICEIPRSAVLHSESTGINNLLREEKERLQSVSGWIPLLLTLMHEYYKPSSKWKPYFNLVPDWNELDHPMFWERDFLLHELKGTGMIELVDEDLRKMKSEFETIALPFAKRHPDYFNSENFTFDIYKRMVAFVMAYSFTEPPDEDESSDEEDRNQNAENGNELMMVPLADILNHVSENNAKLEFGKVSLKMVCVKPIKKGEEVYNTYGELSNSQLLNMYGFALQNNPYDLVELSFSVLLEEYKSLHPSDENIDLRIRILEKMGIRTDETVFAYCSDGFLTEEEIHQTLTVLFKNKEQLRPHNESDDWLECEEDISLTNDQIPVMPEEWKKILRRCFTRLTDNMSYDLYEKNKNHVMIRRQKWATYVKDGQKLLLNKLIKLLEATLNK